MIVHSLIQLIVIFIVFVITEGGTVYDITKYGADKTGKKDSTDAIQKAINAAAEKNGGTVSFPSGKYTTGPIEMKSNVVLNLEGNVQVSWLDDTKLYPKLTVKLSNGKTRHLDFTPLIRGFGLKNVGIKGKGVLDGQGPKWWAKLPPPAKRPEFIHFFDCTNVDLESITIQNSPMFNAHIVECDKITIKGITISNPADYKGKGPNTDGINCNSCTNLLISGVTIGTGDDCIALDANGYGKKAKPTKNVVIENSNMIAGHAGVSIGSITSGGLSNITVKDCNFNNTVRGLFIKTNRYRGGEVTGVQYSNVVMKNVKSEGVAIICVYNPKHSDFFNKDIPKLDVNETTPILHDITFNNVKGTCGGNTLVLVGVPESPVKDITLTKFDVTSTKKKGVYLYNTENIVINGKKQMD